MKRKIVFALLICLIISAGCGPKETPAPTPDVSAISTSAARTVIAELTQTAAFFTPTFEPTATFTPVTNTPAPIVTETPNGTLTSAECYDSEFLADVNIPDGTKLTPGQDFIKTWHIRNIGTCTWGSDYELIYGGYTVKMDGVPVAIGQSIPPGAEVDVSVQFKAPAEAGEYISYWRMKDSQDYPFGEFFYVKIIVE